MRCSLPGHNVIFVRRSGNISKMQSSSPKNPSLSRLGWTTNSICLNINSPSWRKEAGGNIDSFLSSRLQVQQDTSENKVWELQNVDLERIKVLLKFEAGYLHQVPWFQEKIKQLSLRWTRFRSEILYHFKKDIRTVWKRIPAFKKNNIIALSLIIWKTLKNFSFSKIMKKETKFVREELLLLKPAKVWKPARLSD